MTMCLIVFALLSRPLEILGPTVPLESRARTSLENRLDEQELSVGTRTTSVVLPIGSVLTDIAIDPVRPRAYVTDWTNGRVLRVDLDTATLGPVVSVQP